jgi:hypothetical protein
MGPQGPRTVSLRTWFTSPHVGEQLRILYWPDAPDELTVDQFWERHYGSVMVLTAFVAAALIQVRAAKKSRSRATTGSLLRD